MTDLRTSQNISPMLGLREAFAQIGRAVTKGLETEARRKASRRRRHDLDRPRAVVQKAGGAVSLKLPVADPRNLAGREGRHSFGGWDVWVLSCDGVSTALTGTFAGCYDEWAEAMIVAQGIAPVGPDTARSVLDSAIIAPRGIPLVPALGPLAVGRGVAGGDESDYSSWGEVPC